MQQDSRTDNKASDEKHLAESDPHCLYLSVYSCEVGTVPPHQEQEVGAFQAQHFMFMEYFLSKKWKHIFSSSVKTSETNAFAGPQGSICTS